MAGNSMAQLVCAKYECYNEHSFEESHSAVAVLQKVETGGYTFYQCDQGQEFGFVTWQHYHCCHDHMKDGLADCLIDHYSEEKLHPIPAGGGTTMLHRVVLGSDLSCKDCGAPLTHVAYRFCLTLCTPYNHVPDESMDELGGWCCSLEHARQSALSLLKGLERVSP